jgi:hypothetical protein
MEPISTILVSGIGYILKAAFESKTAGRIKEKLLSKFWNWASPYFQTVFSETEEGPDPEEAEIKTAGKLQELVKDEKFYQEFAKQVEILKEAGIKEKNIVKGSIANVKKIRIGDKDYSPSDTYHRKNIVEGNVSDADEFVLGDG